MGGEPLHSWAGSKLPELTLRFSSVGSSQLTHLNEGTSLHCQKTISFTPQRTSDSAVCLQVLSVERTAAWRAVKAAYKRLALSFHPDKQQGATPEQSAAVAQKFQDVAEAHDVLTNEAQRAAYDKVRDYMVSHHTHVGCT